MKTSLWVASPATILVMSMLLTTGARAQLPNAPIGSLTAFPTIVRTGTYPTLTWDITYPSTVPVVITRATDGTLTPKQNLYMDIRVLSASYQTGTNYNGTPIWGRVQANVKVNGSTSWTTVFDGYQNTIVQGQVYYSQLVQAAKPIDFRARCYNGSWYSYRSTESLTANVVDLITGETPPQTIPAFAQNNIDDFLKPYLDDTGKVVMAGPLDIIYLFELGQTNTSASGFDLQDLILLVTFRTS